MPGWRCCCSCQVSAGPPSSSGPRSSVLILLAEAELIGAELRNLPRSGDDLMVAAAVMPDWTVYRFPGSAPRLRTLGEATAAVWDDLDDCLPTTPVAITSGEGFELDGTARQLALSAIRHHRSGSAVPFNDPKVRLSTTLAPALLVGGGGRRGSVDQLLLGVGGQMTCLRELVYDGLELFSVDGLVLPSWMQIVNPRSERRIPAPCPRTLPK
jgi:hypothetical protein